MFLSVTVAPTILLNKDVVLYGKHDHPTLTQAQAQAQAVRKRYSEKSRLILAVPMTGR